MVWPKIFIRRILTSMTGGVKNTSMSGGWRCTGNNRIESSRFGNAMSRSSSSSRSSSTSSSSSNIRSCTQRRGGYHHHHQDHRYYHPPVLVVMAATAFIVSMAQRRPFVTMADAQQTATASTIPRDSKTNKNSDPEGNMVKGKKKCPFYGCPLLPLDLASLGYATEVFPQSTTQKIVAYNHIRQKTTKEIQQEANDDEKNWWVQPIETMWVINGGMATMTLTGYKGGRPGDQINQDRAFVVGPYRLQEEEEKEEEEDQEEKKQEEEEKEEERDNKRILLGVFDGHARNGELVSGYVQTELPKLLAKNLNAAFRGMEEVNVNDEKIVNITKQVLIDTFIELDRTAPAHDSGGCTATVIFKQGDKIFVANTGDSRSFLVTYREKSMMTNIVYLSNEHKPNLPEERRRVESMGGMVYIPARGGTSRVLYYDPVTRTRSGLAMSRSLGDWVYRQVGVIPDPTVDVIDIPELVQAQINSEGAKNTKGQNNDDVHIFAVAASDGMMDYTPAKTIALFLAETLYENTGGAPHLLRTCEVLVETAANGWHTAKGGRYRDDIAIAVSTIRSPPSSTTTVESTKKDNKDEL